MSELRFTPDHEWLRLESNGLITVGITVYAQKALGDVVFVQVPELRAFGAGDEVAVLESVKAASSVYMPLDGEVVEVNSTLESSPELINEDAQGEGWFFRMRPREASAMDALLNHAAYAHLTRDDA
jgi:glycine cleavage system H protein